MIKISLVLTSCSIGINHFWLAVFFFLGGGGGNPFSVGLDDQLFQPASNQVETVEKALA